MRLIIGLGNPGREYAGTRHNVGFEVINKLAYDYNIDVNKLKRRAFTGEGIICAQKCVLLKPQTFMNLSGESVRENIQFYKIPLSDIIVVYDDTALGLGEIRIRKQGSSGGHNGMKNIIYNLDSDIFTRIRVGVGEKRQRQDLADYVLGRFNKDEFENIVMGITKAGQAVEIILKEGADAAMNKFNSKKSRSEKTENGTE